MHLFLVKGFLLGLITGSFLNVVINRLYAKEDIVKKRSYCPHCKKVLKWYELIPIVSFIVQKRRCRGCGDKISWQYPIVEIVTALLFLQASNNVGYQFIWETLFLWSILSGLIVIFVYDLKHFIIPDLVLVPIVVLVLIFRFLDFWSLGSSNLFKNWFAGWGIGIGNPQTVLASIAVALLVALPFAALHFLSRGTWMGFGDVKLAFFMGLLLGLHNALVALFVAFVAGGIMGVILILTKGKKLKSQIPFGPFLVLGTYVALFWGQGIIDWYFSLLL
ncbi:MAG: hypothetical protein A3F94_01530 [Candidatus Spechtbacteria bacterium RIFCSPLOWO2_12_FULL_38_22]|uniref:Prepilin peptidase n=1 Tax=Candidatus Spechtbacteria bacterium RIFCSPLOWO2_12_FULL_38_22 TaxID=1802165 RepID=A0A1G2HGY4_9BACT|nr:MAG: hypothetical protein A2728_01425 [Candidatus Spechtbacteria bacterium RIFCSPHIGHO2_01_FULL_38_11]OGZ59260.1 MAG: hypothetical protein A3A00_01505 [Candidatus Spechtbacteria bacterium RIFCSPLOWO2_01_FULL_38_20]OGZ60268.1 MAG: hypothetical protein A3E58_01135 [Candidatus Spechtbacteria bacterium RIFCSPHIGHO2_12_FULL_38_30]OGZ61511.1 MAG: hypothetical protein A3F94_01530 [Candidatus Spechtbacteria bacterium RIFCSPLOWO2_12_FULL_38_22]